MSAKKTLIKKGASVGANATIVCGNTIGKYALIGADAVITKDVPNYAVVVGNPAKLIGYVCACGTNLEFHDRKSTCKVCGNHYYIFPDGKITNIK